MKPKFGDERGIALILALMITLAVAALAMGGVMIASSGMLTSKYAAKEATIHSLADAGLELARDSINRALLSLPDTGYITIVPGSVIKDAQGNTIPGFIRTVYAGKTGGRTGGPATAGQYGSNYMSVVSVVTDAGSPPRSVAARRGLFVQDSWSRFAVAINNWGGSAVYGCDESISGPFHSNTALKIQGGCTAPKTIFSGPATVVGSVTNQSSGDFRAGITTGVAAIPWPTAAQLATMRQYAQDADAVNGDYDLTSGSIGTTIPRMRIEFLTIDLNADGIIQWDEGFMRVFRTVGATTPESRAYVTAKRWPDDPFSGGVPPTTDPNLGSYNCGGLSAAGSFVSVGDSLDILGFFSTPAQRAIWMRHLLTSASRRCYLGGDPMLFNRSAETANGTLTPNAVSTAASNAAWMTRRLGPFAAAAAVRTDAAFLIPLGRNPNFKGVIYVTGDVAISGRLRGRVSVVATGNILLADDLLYQNAPGTDCSETGDIFGAIATGNIVIEDNNVQTPFQVGAYPVAGPIPAWAGGYIGGFDDTPDNENYNAFLLTLGNFYGEIPTLPGYSGSPATPATPNIAGEQCGGAAAGCIRISGGMTLGQVDYFTYWPLGNANSSGWAERHFFDICGVSNPPPYFPTTGRYSKSRYYEIDPVWLTQLGIGSYFRELQSR